MLELPDETYIADALGPSWWFHIGKTLSEVIMPDDFYKIGPPGNRQFDKLGMDSLSRDLGAGEGEMPDDKMLRSHFNLFYEIGLGLYEDRAQALHYAMHFVARPERYEPAVIQVDPQRHLGIRIPER